MTDFHLVDPQGWEYDLQSVYSAYMGYFQLHSVPWHDRTWAHLFETFEQFLAFSWPAVIVTDARTGRAHIVTRMASITAFLKMVKMRFGETLPQVDNMLPVNPFETSQRQLWHVNDWATYKKLHSTLPVVTLAALKARVRTGDPSAIRELWATRDKTFLAIDFESLERSDRPCVEWGYATIRSGHLEAAGAWPPVPATNYRKGHYIVSEHVSRFNKASPSLSWQYAFGESQVIPKAKLPCIVQSVLSGLVSPDSETVSNNVVLVGHGVQAIMQRLEEMQTKLPSNVLVLDVAYLERALFTTGERGPMVDRKTGRGRLPETLLTLGGIVNSLGIELPCALHNAGNDAFMVLIAFQAMVDPKAAVGLTDGISAGVGIGKGWEGNGHVRRATTVASRLFRPLGGTRSPSGVETDKSGNGNGTKSGHGSKSGKENGHGRVSQARVARHGEEAAVADEMGVRASAKRASMFSTLTSPLSIPVDKTKKADPGVNGSASGSVRGWWSSSTMRPGRRRHSTMILAQGR